MKTRTILTMFFLFVLFKISIGQKMITGATTKIITYKSGSKEDSQMKLSNGKSLVIGFRRYFVEVIVSNGTTGQVLLNIEEDKKWNIMELCEYDFEKDGKNEIVIVYGDGYSLLTVIVFKEINNEYKEIGNFTGETKCALSFNKITLPYGTENLHTEYILSGGKFVFDKIIFK